MRTSQRRMIPALLLSVLIVGITPTVSFADYNIDNGSVVVAGPCTTGDPTICGEWLRNDGEKDVITFSKYMFAGVYKATTNTNADGGSNLPVIEIERTKAPYTPGGSYPGLSGLSTYLHCINGRTPDVIYSTEHSSHANDGDSDLISGGITDVLFSDSGASRRDINIETYCGTNGGLDYIDVYSSLVRFNNGGSPAYTFRTNELKVRLYPTGTKGYVVTAPTPTPTPSPSDSLSPSPSPSPSGDPTPPPDSNTPESYCGISINPLNYLKCLFIPSPGSFTQWNAFQDVVKTKPPLSIASGVVSYSQGFFGGYSNCVGPVHDGCGSGPAFLPNITSINGQPGSFDPITKASTFARDSGRYQFILRFVRIGMYLAFAFFCYKRITTSFGSKDTTGNEETNDN